MPRIKKSQYPLYAGFAVFSISGLVSKISVALRHPLDSDNAQPAVIFFDILWNHNYLLKNWYLVTNTYLFTDFPIYFVLGLLIGMSPFTIKVGALCIFLLGVGLFEIILLRTYGKRVATLALVVVFSVSLFASEIFLQSYFHMGTIAFSFLSFALVQAIIKGTGKKESYYTNNFMLFIIASLAVFSDPYFLFIFVLPLLSTCVVMRIAGISILNKKAEFSVFLVLVVAAISGIILQDVANLWGLHISGFPKLLTLKSQVKQSAFIPSIAGLFNISMPWSDFHVIDVVPSAVNLALLSVVIVCGIYVIKRENDGPRRFAILFFFMMALMVSLAFLGKEKFADYAAARHLSPLVFVFAVFVSLSIAGDYIENTRLKSFVLAILLISSSINIYECFRFDPGQPYPVLSGFLEKENLTYGYSSYYKSNITTLMSNNRVHVRPLFCYKDICRPFFWVSKSDWYRPSLHDGPTFLMIPKAETVSAGDNYETLYAMPDLVIEKFGKPRRVLKYKDLLIYEWAYNIAEKLISVDISAYTPRTTGSFEDTPEGNVIYSQKGEQGALVYGNYWPLMQGEYMALFKIWVQGERGREVAVIDVSEVDMEAQRYTSRRFTKKITAGDKPEWKKYPIEFKASGNDGMRYECRVFVTGAGEVRVKSIIMEKL